MIQPILGQDCKIQEYFDFAIRTSSGKLGAHARVLLLTRLKEPTIMEAAQNPEIVASLKYLKLIANQLFATGYRNIRPVGIMEEVCVWQA